MELHRTGPHPTDPYTWITRVLAAAGSGHRASGRTVLWQCPAHSDPGPSLAVTRDPDGAVLIRCYAGCSTREVLAAIPASPRYLFRPPSISPEHYAGRVARCTFPPVRLTSGGGPGPDVRLVAEHPYGVPAVAWLMRYRHPVTGAKHCTWESRNGAGERVPGLLGRPLTDLPLYQERDAVAAVVLGDPVVVVESESSVDALCRAGIVAVTWAGGAAAVNVPALRRVLGGHRRTVVIPDGDAAGRECGDRIAAALPLARVHALGDGRDARDLLEEIGGSAFRALLAAAAHTA